MKANELNLNLFSPHIFWDVELSGLDVNKNQAFIIYRVLEYGLLSDWVLIYKAFGINEIAEKCTQFKNLDRKSLAFISNLSKKPLEQFKCYTTPQSTLQHLNF
jgi:hypothetical protein